MIQHSAELVCVMRAVLEEVMAKVPPQFATTTAKVYFAEVVLKAASDGLTDHDDLLAAAIKGIPVTLRAITGTPDFHG